MELTNKLMMNRVSGSVSGGANPWTGLGCSGRGGQTYPKAGSSLIRVTKTSSPMVRTVRMAVPVAVAMWDLVTESWVYFMAETVSSSAVAHPREPAILLATSYTEREAYGLARHGHGMPLFRRASNYWLWLNAAQAGFAEICKTKESQPKRLTEKRAGLRTQILRGDGPFFLTPALPTIEAMYMRLGSAP